MQWCRISYITSLQVPSCFFTFFQFNSIFNVFYLLLHDDTDLAKKRKLATPTYTKMALMAGLAAASVHVGAFRNWITADGSSGFKAEAGRYHIYVSFACPYAHRTLLTRRIKGLEHVISIDVMDIVKGDEGWKFGPNPNVDGPTSDSIHGFSFLREVYFKVDPNYSGRFTVPVLFDKVTGTIVNNESAEIIRMLNTEFNEFCATPEAKALDLYPTDLRDTINELNEWIA